MIRHNTHSFSVSLSLYKTGRITTGNVPTCTEIITTAKIWISSVQMRLSHNCNRFTGRDTETDSQYYRYTHDKPHFVRTAKSEPRDGFKVTATIGILPFIYPEQTFKISVNISVCMQGIFDHHFHYVDTSSRSNCGDNLQNLPLLQWNHMSQ